MAMAWVMASSLNHICSGDSLVDWTELRAGAGQGTPTLSHTD